MGCREYLSGSDMGRIEALVLYRREVGMAQEVSFRAAENVSSRQPLFYGLTYFYLMSRLRRMI